MFLKSLTMKGFKSFADPTVLEFEPGLTVVVGPNGSGKSNVVDAVAWVLGAQGPRALRSQKMEDVIFAGTATRPALGRAEVSLTIDNGSGRLPVAMAEVTISRALFRTGDSEYAINGTSCRLLDIQDLLGDSGVGRQQHMIVGQNQLDAVLSAHPEDRRAMVEEAAGVLKHRRRRERAERRLEATEENLERVGDLVRELRRQIRPLERQATAARTHDAIETELRGVRAYLAGRELSELLERKEAVAAQLAALEDEEGALRGVLVTLDEEAAQSSAERSLNREAVLATALARAGALVERARGMANVLAERKKAHADKLDASLDADVVSTLEAEASQLAGALASALAEDASLDERDAQVAMEGRDLDDAEAEHRRAFGDVGVLGAANRSLADLHERARAARRALEADRQALRTAEDRLASSVRTCSEVASGREQLTVRRGTHEEEGEELGRQLEACERAHEAARDAAEDAERAARTADRERHRSAARADALERALEELDGSGWADLLSDVDGVVGSLSELVEVDAGWERAFETAVGAAAAAVVVSGRQAAREAFVRFHRDGTPGALLAAASREGSRDIRPAPRGALALRPHVRARAGGPSEVDAVLDVLLGQAVRVEGWEEALDLALERPDLVVVTTEGDRFSESSWRVRGASGVVTPGSVREARAREEEAKALADHAGERLEAARGALRGAEEASKAAASALHAHATVLARVTAELSNASEKLTRAEGEVEAARSLREALVGRIEEATRTVGELDEDLSAAEARVRSMDEHAAEAAAAEEVLLERRRALAATQRDQEVRRAELDERRRVIGTRRDEVERRLANHDQERAVAAQRRERLEAEERALFGMGRLVSKVEGRLTAAQATLEASYAAETERSRAGAARMEELRLERSEISKRQEGVHERARLLDREMAEASLRADALVTSLRSDLGVDAQAARSLPEPDLPAGVPAVEHARALADRLESLGPVNPLALEELSSLEERQHELDRQMADVRSARRELGEVIRSLDHEIEEQLGTALADVNEHFSELVATLFPGGTGRLVVTDPEHLLSTGVEIEVRPAGRNVRRVSLLSGGERSLAALAFLFAIFRSRPSPFYLMDEVEAALDDVNLHRFLGLVRAFRSEAQLIVVSHQKRTMETADALYGVTMAPAGSSQVVSQKPRGADAGAASSEAGRLEVR